MNIKIWHTRQGCILILDAKLVILKKLDMLSLLTKENLLIQVKSQQSQTTIDMVTVPIFLLFYYWNVWFFRVGCIKPIFFERCFTPSQLDSTGANFTNILCTALEYAFLA